MKYEVSFLSFCEARTIVFSVVLAFSFACQQTHAGDVLWRAVRKRNLGFVKLSMLLGGNPNARDGTFQRHTSFRS